MLRYRETIAAHFGYSRAPTCNILQSIVDDVFIALLCTGNECGVDAIKVVLKPAVDNQYTLKFEEALKFDVIVGYITAGVIFVM